MNPFWKQIVVQSVFDKNKKPEDYSVFKLAKGFRELTIIAKRLFKDVILMSLGIGAAAFGLESFLLPNNFIDGGATGISLLIAEKTGLPLYALLVIINLPFIFLGYRIAGKMVAIKTAVAISGLALCVAFVHFPEVTHDKLLVSVFGGFFLGAGIGLSIRGGAVIDGTEVLAIFLSRKLSTTIGDIIVIINIIIFSVAAYLLSIETALYSLITYMAASKTLDFIIEGIEEYTGVTIISALLNDIREMIVSKLGRGITVYSGKRGHGKNGETTEVDILYTVITRLELNTLKTEIEKIDPNSFVVMSSVKDTKGGMIKKRPLKH